MTKQRFVIELDERQTWVWKRLGNRRALDRVAPPGHCIQCDRPLDQGAMLCTCCAAWWDPDALRVSDAVALAGENANLSHRVMDLENELSVMTTMRDSLRQRLKSTSNQGA